MKYHGKGPIERACESARQKSKEYNDEVVDIDDWTGSATQREGLKGEARRLLKDGGHESPTNYNKIASPGEKALIEDGE